MTTAFEKIVADAIALCDGERDYVANLANIAALAFHEWNKSESNKINWFGFYLARKPDELVLGPFAGITLIGLK